VKFSYILYEHFLCFHEIARTKSSLFTTVFVLLQKTGVNTRHWSGNSY